MNKQIDYPGPRGCETIYPYSESKMANEYEITRNYPSGDSTTIALSHQEYHQLFELVKDNVNDNVNYYSLDSLHQKLWMLAKSNG
jgi:hypothetical protein